MHEYVPDVRRMPVMFFFSDITGSIGVEWWAWCARMWRAGEMFTAVGILDAQSSLLRVSECSQLQQKSLWPR